MQHLVALHVAAGILFAAHVLRPVKGGLQKGSVFNNEIVQVGGVALFDGAKFDIWVTGMISEDMVPLNCRVALALTRPTFRNCRPGKAKPPPGTIPRVNALPCRQRTDVYPVPVGNTGTAGFH